MKSIFIKTSYIHGSNHFTKTNQTHFEGKKTQILICLNTDAFFSRYVSQSKINRQQLKYYKIQIILYKIMFYQMTFIAFVA